VTTRPVATSQTIAVPSPPPASSSLPDGENASEVAPAGRPASSLSCRPVAASHSRTTPPGSLVASTRPLGDKAAAPGAVDATGRRRSTAPVRPLRSTAPPLLPTTANSLPSRLKLVTSWFGPYATSRQPARPRRQKYEPPNAPEAIREPSGVIATS
jgi:hypothetical protein